MRDKNKLCTMITSFQALQFCQDSQLFLHKLYQISSAYAKKMNNLCGFVVATVALPFNSKFAVKNAFSEFSVLNEYIVNRRIFII